nr:hypothetical protein [Candidatus Njordarchaeota archaeon]
MGKRKLTIPIRDDIDRRFREAVFRRKGMKKGNIANAVEEAMIMWISSPNSGKGEKDK